jgi:uncharacterized repeat protein (TIGR02543 family)
MVTNDGVTAAAAVWYVENSQYNPSSTNRQEFIVNGGAVLPDNVSNPNGVPLSLNISVTVNARGGGGSGGGSGSNNNNDGESYLITFNANGGSVAPATRRTSVIGRLSALPSPTRTGYTFVGWYTDRTGGRRITTSTIFEENTTVFAHWTQDEVVLQQGTDNIIVDIPMTVINEIHGNIPLHQVRINTAENFTIRAGTAFAERNAVLVKYDEAAGRLVFVSGTKVGTNGNANLTAEETGDYLVLIFKTGDVTGTGTVETVDALEILRDLADIKELNCIQTFVANGRTGVLNTNDALNILRYVAGIINQI